MRRRGFLAGPAAAGLAMAAPYEDKRILATGDGVPFSAAAYSELLRQLAGGMTPDNFSLGGVVQKIEERMAAELGKEAAIWMPTGTLANHLAVRTLAGEKRRVIVQGEAHLFNDCGDCCQTLSGLHMVPLAMGRATFTLEEIEEWVKLGDGGRVAVPIGAIQIECPVRRRTGEVFDFAEMKRVTAWARGKGIGIHLDGARLYIAAAYTGVSVKEYASLFDMVYVSMYKYFNAASGAVLAGPKRLIENMYHARRMFGGGQHEAWPFAAVALHQLDGFGSRFARAVATSEKVIAELGDRVERVKNGTNLFYLRVDRPEVFVQRAREAGVMVGSPANGRITMAVNESWNRLPASEIVSRLRSAS